MKKNVKRIIALCICCLLLAAAVAQNVYSNKNGQSAAGEDNVLQDTSVSDNDGEGDGVLADVNGETDGEADGEAAAVPEGEGDEIVPTGIACENVDDYLAELRLKRDQARSLEAEECMSVIEDEASAADEKTKAQESVQSIGLMQEIEGSVEAALESKGYEDVFVNYADDGSMDVTLVAKTLVEDEVMAIALLIETATGVTVDSMSLQSVYEA